MRSRSALLLLGGAAGIEALRRWNRQLESQGEIPRLDGELRRWRWRGGEVAYTVAGLEDREPLVLLHGIHAGASSVEFRESFGLLARRFRVYAPDLLGYGLSERPLRRYEPEDVTAQIEDFLSEVVEAPSHVAASSLTAALAVPAAIRSPQLFKRLVLICPTGIGTLDRPSGLLGEIIYTVFRTPLLGDALYNALVSRRVLSYFLKRMAYHDPARVTEEIIDSYYRTAHQTGAKHLPAAFVAGKLNFSVAKAFMRVPQHTLVVWGQEAQTPPLAAARAFVGRNPRAELKVFRDAALLPHAERAAAFVREVSNFLTAEKKG